MPDTYKLPAAITSLDQLEDALSQPTPGVIETLSRWPGDVLVLGVAGKMGPSLARMVRRAADAVGDRRRVIGVARFSTAGLEEQLRGWGVETIRCDLLDQARLDELPDAPLVIAMTGMKFGSTGQEGLTWAMNAYLPGMITQRFRHSRIVAFSTGNVYGLTPVHLGGSREADSLNPLGDYAQSCLGRERIYQHFSHALGVPMALIRLNYATELRYGVLVDIARKVQQREEIDVSMGHFNAIWQADANAMAIQSLDHLASPPWIINVSGPEVLSVRRVAEQFGELLGVPPRLTGTEAPDALISSGQLGHRLFGYPRVSAQQMLHWIAEWVRSGGASLGKPTHFETRDGKY